MFRPRPGAALGDGRGLTLARIDGPAPIVERPTVDQHGDVPRMVNRATTARIGPFCQIAVALQGPGPLPALSILRNHLTRGFQDMPGEKGPAAPIVRAGGQVPGGLQDQAGNGR